MKLLDLDVLKKRGINPYQAVIMAAKEARSLNEKIIQGILSEKEKPVISALEKLLDGRVVRIEEEPLEA